MTAATAPLEMGERVAFGKRRGVVCALPIVGDGLVGVIEKAGAPIEYLPASKIIRSREWRALIAEKMTQSWKERA